MNGILGPISATKGQSGAGIIWENDMNFGIVSKMKIICDLFGYS